MELGIEGREQANRDREGICGFLWTISILGIGKSVFVQVL
jgi:hypothetical protein